MSEPDDLEQLSSLSADDRSAIQALTATYLRALSACRGMNIGVPATGAIGEQMQAEQAKLVQSIWKSAKRGPQPSLS